MPFSRIGSAPKTRPHKGCVRLGLHRAGQRAAAHHAITQVAGSDLLSWADATTIPVITTDIGTWTAMGTSWTQATESKKPEYQASGWAADGGPCVSFDNVGEALSAGDLIGGLSEVSIAATAKTDAASGVLVEHGTPNYYSVNGLGFGTGGTSEYWAGNGQSGGSNWELGSDTITGNEHVWGATFDRAAAMGSELEFSKDSVVQTPGTDEADDTTGTFAADTTYMGARADGGSLPWNGTVREIVIIGRKLTTAELRTLTDALAARGRL